MDKLRNKVVVITGASAGVGRACVRAFARRGARLGLIARSQDGLEAACHEARQEGVPALPLSLDVSDARAVDDAAAKVEVELGPIDVWVNCAMVSVFAPVMDTTAEEFKRVTEVTYLGYVHGTQAALRRMRARNRGTIVQVSSALAHRAIPLQSAYCAAKHAVKGFTESLRSELVHDDVSVHLTEVELPALNTPQFGWSRAKLGRQPQPVPPIFQPELAADAVVFATTAGRRTLQVGWPAVKAILGEKVVPGFIDRYLAKTGYEGQMTDERIPADRPDNLYQALPGDHGAHGRFDARAKSHSAAFWMSKHRGTLLGLGGLALVAIVAGWLRATRA